MQTVKQVIVIEPSSVQELALFYGVSVKVMHRWLSGIELHTGKKRGRFYTARQVARILWKLGIPGETEMHDDI